jgi:nitrous oxide reductase
VTTRNIARLRLTLNHNKRECSIHINNLILNIKDDINWRDHHLVDQTKNLFVYRPTTNGKSSSGVKREVQYFTKLCKTLDPTKKCVIFHPKDEIIEATKNTSKELLLSLSKTESCVQAFDVLTPEKKLAVETDICEIIQSSSDIKQAAKSVLDLLRSKKLIRDSLQTRGNPMDKGRSKQMSELQVETNKRLVLMIENLLMSGNHYIEHFRSAKDELNIDFFTDETTAISSSSTMFNDA